MEACLNIAYNPDFSLSGDSGRSDELAVPSHREAMADLLVFNSAI